MVDYSKDYVDSKDKEEEYGEVKTTSEASVVDAEKEPELTEIEKILADLINQGEVLRQAYVRVNSGVKPKLWDNAVEAALEFVKKG